MRRYLLGPLLAALALSPSVAGEGGRGNTATLSVFFKMSAACNAYYEIEGNPAEAAIMRRLAMQMVDVARARGTDPDISTDGFEELVARTLIGLGDNPSLGRALAEQCPRLEAMVDDRK